MGQVLTQAFGQEQWITQCLQAVQQAVQNSILQLRNGGQVQENAQTLKDHPVYQFHARTPGELQATQAQAAQQGHVDPVAAFARLNDPAQPHSGIGADQIHPELATPEFEEQAGQAEPMAPQPSQHPVIIVPGDKEWLM